MEDASLDQFAEADTASGDDPTADRNERMAADDGRNVSSTEGAIEPATTTSRWTPDAEPCSVCDETVSRLWNNDGELRCRDCTEW